MSDASGEITVSPEIQRLEADCQLLREEVARLLAEAHDLINVVKPNLLAIYQMKLGAWELKRLRLECDIGRLKRKISMIQASINRGERMHEAELEGQLDLEFIDWRTRVAEAVAALDAAKERMDHPMAPNAAQELRDLYRAFVKRLHPDLRPDLTERERQLWYRVQEAYDRADIEELRALALIEPSTAVRRSTALEDLTRERDSLREHAKRLIGELADVEAQPPYTLRKQLADETWINDTRAAIDHECALFEQQRTELENHARQTLAAAQHGNGFSRN